VLVNGSDGTAIPLGQVASISIAQGPPSIRTENAQLVDYIYVDMQGRDSMLGRTGSGVPLRSSAVPRRSGYVLARAENALKLTTINAASAPLSENYRQPEFSQDRVAHEGGIVSIKDIVVHADTTASCRIRLWVAAYLARRFDAYLTGAGSEEAGAPDGKFMRMLADEGLPGEWRTVTGSIEAGLTRLACAADLVILGQPDPQRLLVELTAPEDVIFACGRPVMVVPYDGEIDHVGENVLAAWDVGREATRAVHDALPLLLTSKVMAVLLVDTVTEQDEALGRGMVRHLTRHGIDAKLDLAKSRGLSVADVVLARAADRDSDLIVMGAYGHSRLREMIVGVGCGRAEGEGDDLSRIADAGFQRPSRNLENEQPRARRESPGIGQSRIEQRHIARLQHHVAAVLLEREPSRDLPA
jgi:nucleotide-binding universal stress UspA family protein